MHSKKVFEGRQLLLVVAVFGILLMHATSAQDDGTLPDTAAPPTAATTEESLGEAEVSIATSGPAADPRVEIITSGAAEATEKTITSGPRDATEVSAEVTSPTADSIVAEVNVEATSLAGVHIAAETGSTKVQSQSTEAVDTTNEPGVEQSTLITLNTTETVTVEETTASLLQTKETTAENVTSTRKTTAVDTTTVALSHGYTKNCKPCKIPIIGSSEVWKVNGSICESETDTDSANKCRLAFEIYQRNSTEPNNTWTRNITFKLDCGTYAKKLEYTLNNDPPTPAPLYRRKRQQPDETASESHTIYVNSSVSIGEMPKMLDKALNACITNNDCVEAPPQVTAVLTESSTAAGAVASRAASTLGSIVAGTESSSTSGAGIVGDLNHKPPTKSGNPDIWEAHRGLFLTVLILISVCVIVTVVCCLCMAWRGRGREKHPDKQPISMEEAREAPTAVSNPIPDAEMIRDEAPMQERENPAVTPNGGGQHISKADEDNGWVVPLDELSKAEKEKPEVENTRL